MKQGRSKERIERDLKLAEEHLYKILKLMVRQPNGDYVIKAKYEIEVNDAKKTVGVY